MITLDQFVRILADSMFAGDFGIAGIVVFAAVLAVIFVLMRRNTFAALIIAIPTAFVFSALGILSADMLALLVVVDVIGLALVSKKAMGD